MADWTSLFGGGQDPGLGDLGGISHRDATTLSLLQALQGMSEAGTRRTATPIGSIAQTLAPLLAAPIQARQMEQRSALEALKLKLGIASLLSKEDPERRAADLAKTQAETQKATAETKRIQSEQQWKDELRKDPKAALQKLIGQQGEGVGGLKPSYLVNPETGTVSIRMASDEMTPGRLQQEKEIAGIRANQQLQTKENFETWKQQHPKLTQRQLDALEAGNTLVSMLDEVPAQVAAIPKDIDRAKLAWNASKYQTRSEHPVLTNFATGLTGGLINADSDPRLDPYFSTVGQSQAALASFNLAGLRGGQKTLQWLNVHFPGWGDDSATVERKARFLASNKGIVKQKIEYLQGLMKKSASAAEAVGGEPVGDMVRVKVRDPNGKETYMMIDPSTGDSSMAPDEGE